MSEWKTTSFIQQDDTKHSRINQEESEKKVTVGRVKAKEMTGEKQ